MKKYLTNLFAFIVISGIIFLVFYFLVNHSLYGSMIIGMLFTLLFFPSISAKGKLNKKYGFDVLVFLSNVSIIILIVTGIILRIELLRIILACVALPIVVFGYFWASLLFSKKSN